MQKLSTIGLLLIYLSSNTEMHQLLRLPILVAHFEEHKAIASDITFLEYFSLHYLSGNDHGHDHEDLPFRHGHCEALHIAFALVPELTISAFGRYDWGPALKSAYEPPFHLPSIASSIWQPPRSLS